jgi:4'-phosphopantetheinyl transferase
MITLSPTRIAGHEIHLWRIDASELPAEPILSAAEEERARRRLGDARTEFVASHAAARAIFASYLVLEPGEVPLTFAYGEKPRVPLCEFEISLAHRDQVALLAVGREPVGVDIERSDAFPEDEVDDVAAFILTETERKRLLALPRADRALALAQAWAGKEAVLKALGAGLGDVSLAEIETDDEGRARAEGIVLAVHQLFPGETLIGAVATTALDSTLRVFEEGAL